MGLASGDKSYEKTMNNAVVEPNWLGEATASPPGPSSRWAALAAAGGKSGGKWGGRGAFVTLPPDLPCEPSQLEPTASKNCIRALGNTREVISGEGNSMSIRVEVGIVDRHGKVERGEKGEEKLSPGRQGLHQHSGGLSSHYTPGARIAFEG